MRYPLETEGDGTGGMISTAVSRSCEQMLSLDYPDFVSTCSSRWSIVLAVVVLLDGSENLPTWSN
jgi:hypothetical protein